jgi:hypothetical protein
MADIKKFLDQSGVSTLWSRIAEEVKKVDDKAAKNAQDIATHAGKIQTMEGQIATLEASVYDDSEVRGLIANNKAAHEANAAAIEVLNSGAEVVGSVANTANAAAAAKVAEIVANADADFDTLKEIADWILNDTTGAADMANDIAALQAQMVGIDSTVVAAIAAAIDAALKVEGAEKYALASELSALADRVKAIEDANYQNAEQVGSAIDAKIAALDLANTYDAKGAAATAEANAKAYTDAEVNKVGEYAAGVNQLATQAQSDAFGAYKAAGEAQALANNAMSKAVGVESYVGRFTTDDVKIQTVVQYIDAKTSGIASNETVSSLDARVVALEAIDHTEFEAAGAAAQALADAKAYTDAEIAGHVTALSTAEIDAAIAAAKAQAQA